MVVSLQAAPKLFFRMSIALPWAVEPADTRGACFGPQSIAGAADEEPPEPVAVVLLSSEPQAASDSELTSAMAPIARALERPFRWSFTGVPFCGTARRAGRGKHDAARALLRSGAPSARR